MTVLSLMVFPISLMKLFDSRQVVARKIHPCPLVFKIAMAYLGKPITLSWTHVPWCGRLDLMSSMMDLASFSFLVVNHTACVTLPSVMLAVVKITSSMHQEFLKMRSYFNPILK